MLSVSNIMLVLELLPVVEVGTHQCMIGQYCSKYYVIKYNYKKCKYKYQYQYMKSKSKYKYGMV